MWLLHHIFCKQWRLDLDKEDTAKCLVTVDVNNMDPLIPTVEKLRGPPNKCPVTNLSLRVIALSFKPEYLLNKNVSQIPIFYQRSIIILLCLQILFAETICTLFLDYLQIICRLFTEYVRTMQTVSQQVVLPSGWRHHTFRYQHVPNISWLHFRQHCHITIFGYVGWVWQIRSTFK